MPGKIGAKRSGSPRGWRARDSRSGGTWTPCGSELHSARAIEQAVNDARSVIVLWSEHSAGSDWVEAEAHLAWTQKKLCSVVIEQQTKVPFPYHTRHWLDLAAWDGSADAPVFRRLLRDLRALVKPERRPKEPAPPPGSPSASRGPSRKPKDVRPRVADRAAATPIPEMVRMQPGRFLMGNGAREVRIEQAFAMGKYPVTFEEYDAFAEATGREKPSDRGWGRGRRPVINVSWEDAVVYAAWLSEQTGKQYRLPNEAEWEYAARADTQTRWCFGDDESALGEYAWYSQNAGRKTQPVGKLKPNPWGLYDVHGNVWEWVQDCWHDSYTGAPDDGVPWESGDCDRRVLRGGSWCNLPEDLRSAYRYRYTLDYRDFYLGFRLAQD